MKDVEEKLKKAKASEQEEAKQKAQKQKASRIATKAFVFLPKENVSFSGTRPFRGNTA